MTPEERGQATCPHGMAGFCPDCPPGRFSVGHDSAAPTARVKGRDGFFVVVERKRSDGAFDWFTYHLTRWGARRAVGLYLRTDEVRGWRP